MRKKGENMKTVKYEIKLERSVKIVLGVLAVGILFHALPIIDKGLFTEAYAYSREIFRVVLCDGTGRCGFVPQ